MKNLTERGYSLFFVLFLFVSVELSFLPHSPGTVASGFRDTWTSAKFLCTNVVPSGGGHVPRGPPSVFVDDVGFILVNFKVVTPPGDVDKAEQIVADACDSVSSCLIIAEQI